MLARPVPGEGALTGLQWPLLTVSSRDLVSVQLKRQREPGLSGVSTYKALIPSGQGPTLMASSNLNYLSKYHRIPGLGPQHVKLGGRDTIKPITSVKVKITLAKEDNSRLLK